MRSRSALWLACLGTLVPAAGWPVGDRPEAVSPGSATGTSIADACPTFSWGGVTGARSFDLVVYRIADRGRKAETVLSHRLPGSVQSWTPPLGRCLERGESYAWLIGVSPGKGSASWSEPRLFHVTAPTGRTELEEAMSVLSRYLRDRTAEAPAAAGPDREGAARGRTPLAEAGSARAPAATSLSVDGNVAATSFSGDGSMLTSLAPANLSPGTANIDITGSAGADAVVLASIETKIDTLLAIANATEGKVDALVTDLAAVAGDLDTLVAASAESVSETICVAGEITPSLNLDYGLDAELGPGGRLGVFVYGTGADGNAEVKVASELKAGLEAGIGGSYEICWEVNLLGTAPSPNRNQAELLAALTSTLQNVGILDPTTGQADSSRLLALLQLAGTLNPSLSPTDLASGQETILADLGTLLPLPADLRTKVMDFQGTIEVAVSDLSNQLLTLCDQDAGGVYVNLQDYPPSLRDFLADACDKVTTLDLNQIEMIFGNLASLPADIEMAFATCLMSAQSDFTVPPLSSPAIPQRQITVSIPSRSVTILGTSYTTFPGFNQTYTTFPAFPSQQIYAGDSVPIIDITSFIDCLSTELTP